MEGWWCWRNYSMFDSSRLLEAVLKWPCNGRIAEPTRAMEIGRPSATKRHDTRWPSTKVLLFRPTISVLILPVGSPLASQTDAMSTRWNTTEVGKVYMEGGTESTAASGDDVGR